MPQLNPSPWFAIMIFAWLIFLIIIPPKVMAHTFTNDPSPQNANFLKTESWTWPWH
uniref:ATP synthase complex subunit 8 n=1 Tax=Fundulopanchax filamentosus TaxID=60261 RepID=A0A518LRA5_9TELE|nr:ATP synthase F0 subunit 8 [Fundulopanchax filamentosus]QDV92704.1 ATP synthase F0 subunit 8 [Fundulopanchax filamentosus]